MINQLSGCCGPFPTLSAIISAISLVKVGSAIKCLEELVSTFAMHNSRCNADLLQSCYGQTCRLHMTIWIRYYIDAASSIAFDNHL